MSFYDDASLVFLPSGGAGKDGKAYSIKPTNGDGDFTFSRGSNLTSTRVDSNGLIEKGRENLLLQSNQFDTTWLQTSCSVTSGESGYDGSSNAWLLSKSGSNGRVRQYMTSTGVRTASIYAKEGTTSWLRITYGGKTTYFDLGNGVLGNVNAIDSTITSVGNGFYRCTLTANAASADYVNIYPADSDGVTSGTSGSIYIQDAQLEQGLVATEYIESGATKGKAGLLEQEPRFDYSGGASCPSLLLEPSRSNLIPSEYLPLMSIIGSPVITPNATTSPEGYQNMAEFSSSATSDRYQKNLGVLSGQHTFSAFFKYSGTDKSVYLRMSDTSSRLKVDIASSGVTIDSGGSLNIDDSDVIDYGNGIYRAYMIFTPSTGTTFAQFYPSATDTSGSIYAYGFQIEAGSYPTSYIPNHSGGSVTRDADSAEVTSASSIIGQTEGTIFLEFKADNVSLDIIGINRSTTNGILIFKTASNLVKVQIYSGGSSTTLTNTGVLSGVIKLALVYKSRESSLFINGTKVATSTNNLSFTASLNLVEFMGNYFAGIGKNEVQQTLLFPTALSDNNCITLTS